MRRTSTSLGTLLGLWMLAATSCSKKQAATPPPPSPVMPAPPAKALITLPSEWSKATSLMNGFPPGIEVYQRTQPFNGKAMNAYCVVFDPKSRALEFKPVFSASNKKPSVFYSQEPGVKYAVINGGYFGTNTSYSLAQYNGTVMAINIKSLNRTYNGTAKTYYPTRGAFGITSSGNPDLAWIYHVGPGNGTVYAYPQPSQNDITQSPQQQPSAGFPAGGSIWGVSSAIGGSPVLIKDGIVDVKDGEELIDVDNTSARPRSAIGHTANGNVIILAVEGNNPAGGAGLNLQDLASLMKSMGCTAALNLDGGGSTFMMVNGQATVKPSDSGGERAVITALIIKKK